MSQSLCCLRNSKYLDRRDECLNKLLILLGGSMLSCTSVLGAALASWNGTDGIARLKCKKEQPPRPLIKSSGLDPVSITTYIL